MALRSAADPRLLAPSAEQPAKPYGLFSNSRRTSKSRQLRSRSTLTSLASSNSRSTALSERLGSALGWRWLGRGSCFFHRYQPLDDDANLLKTSDFEDDDEEEAEIDGCVESRCDVDAVQHCWEGLERAWQERKHDDIEKPVFYDIVNMMCDSLGIRKPEHRDMALIFGACDKPPRKDLLRHELDMAFTLVAWYISSRFHQAGRRRGRRRLQYVDTDEAWEAIQGLCKQIRVRPPNREDMRDAAYWHEYDDNGRLNLAQFLATLKDLGLMEHKFYAREPSNMRTLAVEHEVPRVQNARTTLTEDAHAGDRSLIVDSIQALGVGNQIRIAEGELSETNFIKGFHIEVLRGIVQHARIQLQSPLARERKRSAQVEVLGTLAGKKLDEWEPGNMIEGCIPKASVDVAILKLLRNTQIKQLRKNPASADSIRLAAKFADRDVVGPAIPWSFLAIVQWFLLIPFASAAYRLTPPVEGPNCFSSYPPWLYCFVFMAYLGHFYVQVRILRYVNVAHVQQLEPQMPFEFFGVRTSYSMWLLVVFCIGFLDVMDIASHSLLYGKFVKSYDTNPDIAELWSQTISQSGMHAVLSANMARFFFIGWLFILLQPIIMLMHACPTTRDPSQMDYGLPNPMPDGYLTLMSYVMRFDISPPSTKDCKGDNNQRYGCCEKRRYWHADILRVMSEYGRLTAVTWNDRRLMVKRLERAGTDPQQGKLRFLQIYVTRLNEYCFRVLFMDIFEKAFKLEMQVSIVAFAHALRPPRAAETYKGARNCLDFLSLGEETLAYWILEYDWQMLVPALLAFVSLVRACILHVRTLWQLTALYMRHIVNKPDNGDQHNKTLLRTETDYDKYLGHSRSVATGCMACYVFLILVLACFCLHCSYKVVMMFVCPDSVANMVGGCVEIDFDRPWKNYEVRQDL